MSSSTHFAYIGYICGVVDHRSAGRLPAGNVLAMRTSISSMGLLDLRRTERP